MNEHQAKTCTSKRNNAVLHETPKQTPIAGSLEPCADVHKTVLSLLDTDTGRRNSTKHLISSARATTCSKRPITEQQDTHVEKACLLDPRFLPGQMLCRPSTPREGRVWSPHKNYAARRIRQLKFPVVLQMQPKTFLTHWRDAPSN